LEPFEYIVCHINLEITDNLRDIFKRWRNLCDFFVDIYSIERYQGEEYSTNDLALSVFNPLGALIIYVSDHYPEAHIIHEMLHAMLRIEGYPQYKLNPKLLYLPPKIFLSNKYLIDPLKKISDELTNNIDHILINKLMEKYDLDFRKLRDIQYQYEYSHLEKERKYDNIAEKVMDHIIMAIGTLEYDSSLDEIHRCELLDILKQKHIESYKYRSEFAKIIEEYPHSNPNEYKILLIKILEKIKNIFYNEIEEYKGLLDLIIVE